MPTSVAFHIWRANIAVFQDFICETRHFAPAWFWVQLGFGAGLVWGPAWFGGQLGFGAGLVLGPIGGTHAKAFAPPEQLNGPATDIPDNPTKRKDN